MQITLSFNPIWTSSQRPKISIEPMVLVDRIEREGNLHLLESSEQYEKVMNRLKEQDPNMYAIYALGEWGNKVEGLIFEFEEIDDVPAEAIQLGYGQDF